MDANAKLEALKTFYSEMEGKNHFELLGIPQTADDGAVRSAYFDLLKKYGADHFHHVVDADGKKAVDEVNKQLRKAYDAIGKKSKREAYIAQLNGTADDPGPEIDIAAVFEAEQATSQARSLMERGEFKVAIQKLEKARKIDTKNPEVDVRLAYCNYMISEVGANGKRDVNFVRDTLEQLEAKCEALPNADFLRVFLGDVEKLEGHEDKALEWYKAALKINKENISAKREIKLAEERKQREMEAEKAPAGISFDLNGIVGKIKGLFKK